MNKIVIAALYKFAKLTDYQLLREPLLSKCESVGLKGTLLLAEEGINGTIAGSREGIDSVLSFLREDTRLSNLSHKESHADSMPFLRMKVKLKNEIVTLGQPGISPTKRVGEYVSVEHWNDIISDPDVVVIDTRNKYEVDIGTFKRAINPNTTNFREFPEFVDKNLDPGKHKKVAMFCTGGIRCEKASALMIEKGFENVYHLKDGILKYLEQVDEKESLWQGECFVFDQRVSVKHRLEEGQYQQCFGCRHPISESDIKSEQYQEGICCPHCYNELSEDKRLRLEQRQLQIKLAAQRDEPHLGKTYERHKRANAETNIDNTNRNNDCLESLQ